MIELIDEEEEEIPDILNDVFQLKRHQSEKEEEEKKRLRRDSNEDESFEIIEAGVESQKKLGKQSEKVKQEASAEEQQ